MSTRHDTRASEAAWALQIARRPITQADIVATAFGQMPRMAQRLASACRQSAAARHALANDTRSDVLQREHRAHAAELEAAAQVLERLK